LTRIGVCLILGTGQAFGGSVSPLPDYHVRVWRVQDGLPQSTVTCIAQSPDGYLWLGTQNGLVRFDGVAFKVFDQNNSPAIKNNRIVQLFVDHQGALWVGAEHGNLFRLLNGTFTSFDMPGNGTTFNYARAICDDAQGQVWVLSCEWRLMCVAGGKVAVPSASWGLSSARPNAVARDQSGRVCVGTERELALWTNGYFQSLWGQAEEEHFGVDFLATNRKGGWWVAGNGRLRQFEGGRWIAERGAYAWTNQPIYGLYEDHQNRLWVATLGGGLFRYDPDGAVLHLTTREGLPTDFVRCVTEDREGNIWAGTEGGGVCRLKPSTFDTVGVRQGLASDQVMSVCESTDGSYWIGMNGRGIDHWREGRIEHYDASRGLMNGHVWSVLQDRQGVVWAGTWGGLFKLDRDGFANVSDGSQVGGVVLAMYQDHDGGLWLGQQACGVLTRISDGGRSAVQIPGTSANLDVRTLAEDREGSLWVGTEDEGLYRRKAGLWTHWGRKDGLENESVWSLYADGDGALWIGTCGGGLSRWGDGRIDSWTTKDGLANNVICQILEDNRGNLWFGSYGGVFRISKQQLQRGNRPLQCVSYDQDDGLPSIECQGGFQPSGWKSRDGRLWFPTIKGLAVVNPDRTTENPLAPLVMIEDVLVDGASAEPVLAAARAGGTNATIEVPPDRQGMDFNFTAISLTAPEKVRFQYQMENLESARVEAGGRRTVHYSHLPPGRYRFHVVACNSDGVWNQTGDALAVIVLPHFWQTGWFLVSVALLSLASAAGLANYVAHRQMRRRLDSALRQRALERERTRIAQDMHDDLGSHLTEIAFLSEFAQAPECPPEAVRADLRKIMSKARALTASLDEIVWAVEPENDSLESFVAYACSFAETYLREARIACRLELPSQLPDAVLPAEARHNLFLAFKEAINNIVKHARAKEVRLRVGCEAGRLAVTIRDDGGGFDPRAVDSREDSSAQPSGLANIRKRLEKIGGQGGITSAPGAGTEVKLSIPISPP
jgi:ligand-binding sensor domain-containing protein/signal transduction histidine kinase